MESLHDRKATKANSFTSKIKSIQDLSVRKKTIVMSALYAYTWV